MGRNNMLSIMEVKLFTPFRYEDENDDRIWMLIGALDTKTGYSFVGTSIDKYGFYCGIIDSAFHLTESAKDVPSSKFIKLLMSKWNYDQEQIMAFMIGIGKDGRPQADLKDFS